jgi:endonuclease/exonuclease/phosphatase family metal-dependent hydrolase
MTPQQRLRVMSANLWNQRVDARAFAELCSALDLDVVCAQELARDAADALNELYPYGRLDPRDDFSGMGIALRHPAKLQPLPMFHKNGQVAVLEPEDWPPLSRPLQVVNLHLAAPGPRRLVYSLRARRRQLDGLTEFIDTSDHDGSRVLLGDFNSTPLWPLYRQISRRGHDLHTQAARDLGRLPRRTWGPTAGSPRLLRIDHAFGEGVRAVDAWVVEVAGSDHSALVLDLEESP